MNKKSISRLLLIVGLLILLSGCAASHKKRVLWPAPPQTPKVELIGVYYSESDIKVSDGERALEALLGEGGVRLVFPWGVAADGKGRTYVSDPGLGNVFIFDFNKREVAPLFERMAGKPYGLTIDASGRIYVVVPDRKNVVVMDADHRPLFNFGAEVLTKPNKIVVDDARQRIYVSDIGAHTVEVFDLQGQHIESLGGPGDILGRLYGPTGVAVDKKGNLYVSEGLNARIHVFSPEGEPLYFFGQRSDRQSGFEQPKDLAFDSEGNLHIVDQRKGALLSYSPKGEFLLYTGTGKPSPLAYGFAAPVSIFIDKDDKVFITDLLNKRFVQWQYLSDPYLQKHPITEADLEDYGPKF